MISLTQTEEILKELVSCNSSYSEPCDGVCGVVEKILKKHFIPFEKSSFCVEGLERSALVARIGPKTEGGIVLSGHLDVVPAEDQKWIHPPFNLTDTPDRYFGRGTCDMKGFIACALSLIPYWLTLELDKPIFIVLTTDEEVNNAINSITHAINLLSHHPKPKLAIVGEPTNMDIVVAHKGVHRVYVDITGRAAHSSIPQLGINSIEIAHEIITYIQKLSETLIVGPRDETMEPPYITVNIATISGGTAFNIVPEHCSLGWSFRYFKNEQAIQIENDFRAFIEGLLGNKWHGASISVNTRTFPSMEAHPENPSIEVVQKLLPESKITTAPYGTEAGFFQQAGIHTIVCGPGSIEQAHKPDEFILKSELEKCLAFLSKVPLL